LFGRRDQLGVLRDVPAIEHAQDRQHSRRDLVVDDAELRARRDGWSPNPPRYTSGVLGKYARLVQGAETGAITNPL